MERSVFVTIADGGLETAFVSRFCQLLHTVLPWHLANPRLIHCSQPITYPVVHTPITLRTSPIDLRSLYSIRAASAQLNKRVSPGEMSQIQALILNAAVQHIGSKITVDEFESHFTVNYLANFMFVLMTLESMDNDRGMIVLISNALHDSYHWMSNHIFSASGEDMFGDVERMAYGFSDGLS
jgi:NAD(P)-dependent dehydrogenase (short-subunit alcohol dehydrogenase family)